MTEEEAGTQNQGEELHLGRGCTSVPISKGRGSLELKGPSFPLVKPQREPSWQDDDVFRLTLDSFFLKIYCSKIYIT